MGKYIKYVKKFLSEIIFLPIYWISFFFPKNKNIWIFGEWHGLRYSDNSKYLFEYVHKYAKNIKVVWITKDKMIAKNMHNQDHLVLYAYNVLGIYYCLRANLVFVTHDAADVGHYFIGGATLINLTHGVPLKHLGNDAIYNRFGTLTKVADRFILPLLPLKKSFDYILCADERSKSRFESAFIAEGRVFPIGYPRWDGFNNIEFKLDGIENYKKVILYAPTLRFNNHIPFKPSSYPDFNKFLEYIKDNEVLCLFRPHPSMTLDREMLSSDNVWLVDSKIVQDINALYILSDMLLTDYSSTMYDFSLLGKSMAYFVPDLDVYLNEDVGVYGDFYSDALGPICKDWLEVINALDSQAKIPCHKDTNKKYEINYFSASVFSFVKRKVMKEN